MHSKSFLGVVSLNLALASFTACTDPVEPTTASHESAVSTCYNFSSFAGSFMVGDVVAATGATINFQQFQWSNGMWTAGGIGSVVASNFAAGTPVNELNLNNIFMRVTPNTPSAGASYRYADLGGNVNFGVNGDFRNVGDISTLNGTVIGGCDVLVTRTNFPGGYRGIVEITPQPGVTLDRFGVGGQEFYVDDVCQ